MMRIALALAALAASAGPAFAVKAADDQTPLLFDRVRTFDAVVIATAADGFEKSAKPVPSTNCVTFEVKVEKTLKGALKAGGTVRISCHERLPALLAARDAKTNHRYLLAVNIAGADGYLGSANLYGDLERCFLADESLESVVKAFIAAEKTGPADLLALCLRFLGDATLSDTAGRHINDLLARAIQTCPVGEAAVRRDAAAALEAVFARMAKGLDVDSGTYAAQMYADVATMNNVAEFKAAEQAGAAKAGEALCAWLKAALDAQPDPAAPDYRLADGMKGCARLLGLAKGADSAGLLVRLAKDSRWPDARATAVSSLAASLGAKAEEPLRALLKDLDKAGNERIYNAVVDALTGIGKGEGLTRKAEPFVFRPMM